MKIRAAVLEEFGRPLEVQQVDLAEPGPGEVLVRLVACGVCHTDMYTASGADPSGYAPTVLGNVTIVPSTPSSMVPIGLPSTKMSTCAPGSVVPVNVGVVSLVALPSAGLSSTGGPRTVKPLAFDAAEVPPAVVCFAVAVCWPVATSYS